MHRHPTRLTQERHDEQNKAKNNVRDARTEKRPKTALFVRVLGARLFLYKKKRSLFLL